MFAKRKPIIVLTTFITLVSLGLAGHFLVMLFKNNTSVLSTASISYATYEKVSTQEDILDMLLTCMENNNQFCYFNVNDQDMINADYWLNSLSGIQEIHCEYVKTSDGFNVIANLRYWDNYPIVYAFRTGNTNALNERQLELYNKYCLILNTYTSASRPQWQNQLTIHDYLIDSIQYYVVDDSEYNAYNALIDGKTVCSGYAEAFKTFMDMLDIECITISGTANSEAHVWNLVLLDGDWYHVDVTWDDPLNGDTSAQHYHFNISDNIISITHTWDTSLYPVANGTKYAYKQILKQLQ